ncbi:MAG: hypothetical protein ACTSVG_01895 [Alphaproteobacteria bacterium]
MMSMLTFVVIMVAVGTLIQRVDVLDMLFGEGTDKLEFRQDEAIVRANALSGIDVLANDLGIKKGDAENLIVVEQPECGRVFVRDGQAHYLPAERCVGSQRFKYAISGRSPGHLGDVVVVVRLGEPTQSEVAADAQRDIPAPAPVAPRAADQRVAEAPALLVAEPSAGGDGGGAVAPMSTPLAAVPQPRAPAIAGLADTTPAAGSTVAGVAPDGSGTVPSMAAPVGGLGAAPETAAVPVVQRPDPEAPALPAPVLPDSAQPARQSPAPAAPEAPPTGVGAPRLLPASQAPLPAGSAAVDGTSTGSGAGSENEAMATIALARIDPDSPGTGVAVSPTIQRENDGLDTNVPRTGLPEIGSGGAGRSDFGQPADALAGARALGDAIELAPVDTTPPALLSGAGVIAGAGAPQTGEQRPQSATVPGAREARVAALPSPTEPCTVPPALILDVKPAGLTEVVIDSPCHARTVAELSYDGLRFGVALDGAGAGAVAAVGFQQASDAVLRFSGGESIDFNIPFADTERMARVALVWETPVDLDLHAFEFGALGQSDGHVRPDAPRSFGDVRRRGGGYLLEYLPVAGVGQSVSVYTYWRRYGGRSGVVRLGVDFASRDGGQRPDTCAGGALAEPAFTVLRSVAGVLERSRNRRLAPLDCAANAGVAGPADRIIGDAVDDMIVLNR